MVPTATHMIDIADILFENRPSNKRINTTYGIYPFKVWTIACIMKYIKKIDKMPSSTFHKIVQEWQPTFNLRNSSESCE